MAWAAMLVIHQLFVPVQKSISQVTLARISGDPRAMVCLLYSGLHTRSRCSPSDGF